MSLDNVLDNQNEIMSRLINTSNRLVIGCIILFIIISLGSNKMAFADETKSEILPTISKMSHNVDNSGALKFSVPIEVPPGRNGLAPNLSVRYNSNSRNGWLGVGWDLNLSSIQRSTKYGLDYLANDFVVTGSGQAELVSRSSDWGAGFYGAKIEGAFFKYFFDGTSWVATTREGTKYYYGTNENTISRQDGSGGKFKWCLDKILDTNGNYITITYTTDNGTLYPNEIGYNYNNDQPATAVSKIVFALESRSDVIESYKNGNLVKIAKRLDKITTYGQYPNASTIYDFNYIASTTTNRSLLDTITISGTDGTTTTTLPETIFSWQERANTVVEKTGWSSTLPSSTQLVNGIAGGIISMQQNQFYMIDVNGDASADFVYRDKYYDIRVLLSSGNDFSTAGGTVWGEIAPITQTTATPIVAGDVNGDGLMDLVYDAPSTTTGVKGDIHVLLSNGSQFTDYLWGQRTHDYLAWFTTFFLADMNGDGCADFVYDTDSNGIQVLLGSNNIAQQQEPSSDSTWGARGNDYDYILQAPVPFGTIWNVAPQVGDVNGDGRNDFVYLSKYDHKFRVLLANKEGTAFEVEKVWGTRTKSWFPSQTLYVAADSIAGDYFYENQFKLGDVNGDGLADIVFINALEKVYSMLGKPHFDPNNESIEQQLGVAEEFQDYQWSNYSLWSDISYNLGFSLADVNGDGKSDFIYDTGNNRTAALLSDGSAYKNIFWGDRSDSYLWYYAGTICASGYGCHNIRSSVPHQLADINGDGLPELIYIGSSGLNVSVLENEFVGGSLPPFPDLLSSINNGLGSTSAFTYEPSSKYDNSVTLTSGETVYLPFVLNTVSAITTDPATYEAGSYITSFQFAGGYYDRADREFGGFGFMHNQYPNLSIEKSWYHQDEWFKFRPDLIELWSPDQQGAADTLLTTTDFIWEKIQLGTSDSYFVRLGNKRHDLFDTGGSGFSQTFFTYDDSNGFVATKTAIGTGVQVSIVNSYIYENKGQNGWVWRLKEESLTGKIDQYNSGLVNKTTYSYENETGNLLSQEFWWREKTGGETDPRIENLQYDVYGNLQKQRDANGFDTQTTYDTLLNAYSAQTTLPSTSGVSHITLNEEYDYRFGKPTKIKDENNNYTFYEYDNFGRVTQIDYPGGGQQIKEYYDAQLPRLIITKVKETSGNDCTQSNECIAKYEYFDGQGRLIKTINLGEEETPGNNKTIVTRMHYDEMGRAYLTEGPYFGSGTGFVQPPPASYFSMGNEYDFLGRAVKTTTPDGTYGLAETIYTYNGFDVTISDPDQKSKTEKRDYLDRLIEVVEYGDNSQLFHTYYTYNAVGELLTVVNALGDPTEIFYDSLGRKKEMNDPDMGNWFYTYDLNNNLLTQTDAENQIITFDYDELNRIKHKNYSTPDPQTTYDYDAAALNGIGRLTSVSNGLVTTSLDSYDAMGRELSITRTIDGAAQSYTTQYDYDLAGRQSSVTYPDNYRVDNVYYPRSSLLYTVIGQDGVEYGSFTDYEPSAKIGKLIHDPDGNNTATIFTYDPWSTRMTAIFTEDSSGLPANDLQRKDYLYSAGGDIIQINDDLRGITYDYWYDNLHRLKAEVASGNIENHQSRDEGLVYEYNHLDHAHAVSDINYNGTDYSYVYDANGNLVSGPDFTDPLAPATRNIVFNSDNMPTTITHSFGGSTDILYDGEGTRARLDSLAKQVYYVNNLFEVIDGVETRYIFGNDLRLAKVTATETSYFHKDHLGSSVIITDESGAKVEASENFPYGLERMSDGGVSTSDYKFTDQELDRSSNLYNYDARLYDPVIGRFVSADTIVPDYTNPQSLNRYSYVLNNPLIYVDPTGHVVETPWDIFNFGIGVGSFVSNLFSGNWGAAAVDFGGAVVDLGAIFVPGVPGGAGTSIKAIRGADKVGDIGGYFMRYGDDVADASKGAGRKFWTNATEFKGNKVYQRNDLIDVGLKDARGRTNLDRMQKGLAPIGPDGKSMNLHHMTQTQSGGIAEVSQTFHRQNSRVIHINPSTTGSGINRADFNKWRTDYWQSRANNFQ